MGNFLLLVMNTETGKKLRKLVYSPMEFYMRITAAFCVSFPSRGNTID